MIMGYENVATALVVINYSALGLVKKGAENYIGKMLGNIRISELQRVNPIS